MDSDGTRLWLVSARSVEIQRSQLVCANSLQNHAQIDSQRPIVAVSTCALWDCARAAVISIVMERYWTERSLFSRKAGFVRTIRVAHFAESRISHPIGQGQIVVPSPDGNPVIVKLPCRLPVRRPVPVPFLWGPPR